MSPNKSRDTILSYELQGSFHGVLRPEPELGHSPSSGSEADNEWHC